MLRGTVGLQEWRGERIRAIFRAAPGPGEFPAIATTGTAFWTPPVPAYVRGIVAVPDAGDILVAAGGATLVSMGLQGEASTLILATTFANWNVGAVRGWGTNGVPAPTGGGSSSAIETGIQVCPLNAFFAGETNTLRTMTMNTNLGTATGTLLIRFEWRPMLG